MTKTPFLPLFFGDFLASTAEWLGEERSLYLTLLGHQWSLGSLPIEAERVRRIVQWDAKLFARCWPTVRAKFEERDGRLYNARLEQHRDKADALAEKNRASGRKGAAARWQNDGERHGERHDPPIAGAIAAPKPRHESANGVTHSNPSHPIPDKTPQTPASGGDGPPANGAEIADVLAVFEHWRTVHGHRTAKLDSKRDRCIRAALKLGYSADQLRQAIDGYKLDEWHQGRNDRGKVFDALTLILRDAEHIDRGLKFAGSGAGVAPIWG